MLTKRYEKLRHGRQRAAMIRFLLQVLRDWSEAYVPPKERMGVNIENAYICAAIVLGDMEGRPFSASKIARYIDVPRTTILRRLTRLERWGLIYRVGRNYFASPKAFNSLAGLTSYRRWRKQLVAFTEELSILDNDSIGAER